MINRLWVILSNKMFKIISRQIYLFFIIQNCSRFIFIKVSSSSSYYYYYYYYYYCYYFTTCELFKPVTRVWVAVSLLISRILLNIPTDFNNAVVYMVSILPLISNSFSLLLLLLLLLLLTTTTTCETNVSLT